MTMINKNNLRKWRDIVSRFLFLRRLLLLTKANCKIFSFLWLVLWSWQEGIQLHLESHDKTTTTIFYLLLTLAQCRRRRRSNRDFESTLWIIELLRTRMFNEDSVCLFVVVDKEEKYDGDFLFFFYLDWFNSIEFMHMYLSRKDRRIEKKRRRRNS